MASKLPHERLNQAPNFDYLICKVLFKPIHSTTVLVPIGTAHPLPVPSGTGFLSEGCRRRVGCVKYCLIARMFKPIYSTTVLVPTGTAAQCRRREPPVLDARRSGGEWDVCHCTKFDRAATEQGFVVVAARLSLVMWGAYYSPPALEAIVTGVDAVTRGLRLWLSTATAPPFKTMDQTNHSTIFLVPIGTAALCRRREPTVCFGAAAGGE